MRDSNRAQPGKGIFLSVVLPAYNEEATIARVISEHMRILAAARGLISDWEIVCVDDASADNTAAIAREMASQTHRVRVVRHDRNQGIYRSLAEGFAAARGTHIYATAADGQWPARYILRMLAAVRAGADLVVAARSNRPEVYGPVRRFVSFAFNLLPRLLFGVRTVDAGSVKLGVREVFQLSLFSRSPFAEAERILRARLSGFRVAYVPIRFRPRAGGKATGAKLVNILTSLRDCLRCVRAYGLSRSALAREESDSIDRFARECTG